MCQIKILQALINTSVKRSERGSSAISFCNSLPLFTSAIFNQCNIFLKKHKKYLALDSVVFFVCFSAYSANSSLVNM